MDVSASSVLHNYRYTLRFAQPLRSSMETNDLVAVRKLWFKDKTWSVYALADLQDPTFRPHCRWFVSGGGEEEAVVLLFTAFEVPVIIAQGADQSVKRILDELELPFQLFAMVQESHYELLKKYYAYDSGIDPMVRMVLEGRSDAGASIISQTQVGDGPNGIVLRRLTVEDEPAARALFSHGGSYAPGAFFSVYQIESGLFYGAFSREEELLAVGGTHVVDRTHSAAAIGNMYTHPEQRQKGLATKILRAIISDLQSIHIDTIVLNVNQHNQIARSIYEQFGFRVHCNYIEGLGTLTSN